MGETKLSLPEFNKPPVVETVLSVQFNPLPSFSTPQFFLFWTKIRANYPQVELQPPIEHIIEWFGPGARQVSPIGFEILSAPELRCWFIDQSGNRLLQLQKDRFIFNWRKTKGDEIYPRYDQLKPQFKEEWEKFNQFLNEEKAGVPSVNQCEVTYVNHIEIDKEIKSFSEANKIAKFFAEDQKYEFLPSPETVTFDIKYILPDKNGRLHINMQPVIRQWDNKVVLQLNLTVRGRPSSSKTEDLLKWFDFGREWIVRGFKDFTTKKMHDIWEIRP